MKTMTSFAVTEVEFNPTDGCQEVPIWAMSKAALGIRTPRLQRNLCVVHLGWVNGGVRYKKSCSNNAEGLKMLNRRNVYAWMVLWHKERNIRAAPPLKQISIGT